MIEFSELKEMPKAYVKVCAEIKNPVKNKKGVHGAMYADMDQVIEVSKPVLSKHGFAIIQHPFTEDDKLGIETMMMHESGEYIRSKFSVKIATNDPQKIGSAITYYKRYALVAFLNLVAEADDDADSVSAHAQSRNNPTNNLASDAQKYTLKNLMGKQYVEHKDFIENKMTKKQASQKIEELMK